jgi:hypothetical protein
MPDDHPKQATAPSITPLRIKVARSKSRAVVLDTTTYGMVQCDRTLVRKATIEPFSDEVDHGIYMHYMDCLAMSELLGFKARIIEGLV